MDVILFQCGDGFDDACSIWEDAIFSGGRGGYSIFRIGVGILTGLPGEGLWILCGLEIAFMGVVVAHDCI